MKAIVRDDIISLDAYVAAEFKYKEYLEALAGCGGYCFLEQFERLLKSEGGKYLAKKMEDNKLIKTDYFSKYKFVRLTQTAFKYLYYRNDERDFTGIPKNKIPGKNLKPTPSEKVLFTSAMYFELYYRDKDRYNYFIKENHIKLIEEQFLHDYSDKIMELKKLIDDYNLKLNIINNMIINIKKIVENEENNNKHLKSILDKLSEDKTLLEDKKNIFMKHTAKIDRIEYLDKELNKLLTSNNGNKKLMKACIDSKNTILDEIENIKNEIQKYKTAQILSEEKTRKTIKYFMQLRDISKVICIYNKTNFKLMVISTFIKQTKSNYTTFLKDIVNSLYDKGVPVKTVELNLVSIYKLNDKVKKAISDDIEKINSKPITMEIDLSVFDETIERDEDFYKWRDIVYRDSILKNIEYRVNFGTLSKLEKYFDTASDQINYIKKKDIKQFEELKNKLAKK